MTGRRGPRLVAVAALAGVLVAALLPAATLGAAPDPKVVLVVGPVGGLTDSYRRWARAGAAEARRWTDDVVEVYSPNATWPAVSRALQGASIVVYLGHGNGFPSPYGTSLRRDVQNGFGLNPVAGRGDGTHQYFGEAVVAEQVRLSPGAVVLLFHLCYASGNSEPGVPEGTEAMARQRIDNFSAGFLAAGASAVVAEAYGSPAAYMRALLKSKVSARTAFSRASTANGRARAFASERTPGAVAIMDPERGSSGFTRSLVLATGASGIVPAGPVSGSDTPAGGWEFVIPPDPTPAPDAFALGARPGAPTLAGVPIAGSTVELGLPVEVPADVKLGTKYRLGMRWIPLDGPAAVTEPAEQVVVEPEPTATQPAATEPAATQPAATQPAATQPAAREPAATQPAATQPAATQPGGSDDPADGVIAIVAPEAAASLVDVVEAATRDGLVAAPTTLPATSGRYRLEVTVHDADGVALPYAVQASIPDVIVHVGGPGAAWIDAPASVQETAGTRASVQVIVTNGEADPWGSCTTASELPAVDAMDGCPAVRLVGRWLALAGDGAAPNVVRDLKVPAASAVTTWLAGPVPAVPGTYLLITSLERSSGSGPATVLGRPVAITVQVVAAPLVPSSGG